MQSGGYDGRRRRRNERITSHPRRQAQARGGSRNDQRYRSSRNYRTIRGTDTGYNLRKRSINFAGVRGGNVGRAVRANPRPWLLGLAVIVLAALLVFGMSRCVRSCSAAARTETNEQDARVAAGVSTELTSELTSALDRGEQLAAIAAAANKIDDRLVRLSLAEPGAIGFVASYAAEGAEHTTSAYDSKVTKGYYSPIYCWDARWGAAEFAGGPLAVTGSGPTTLAMAYYGLTGKADITPADIAERVTSTGQADAALGVAGSFLTDHAADFGLSATKHDMAAGSLSDVLDSGTVVLLQLKEGGLTGGGGDAHWALAATENADGTINVYDPTSTAVSARPWAASTITSASDALYAITARATSTTTGEDGSDA